MDSFTLGQQKNRKQLFFGGGNRFFKSYKKMRIFSQKRSVVALRKAYNCRNYMKSVKTLKKFAVGYVFKLMKDATKLALYFKRGDVSSEDIKLALYVRRMFWPCVSA